MSDSTRPMSGRWHHEASETQLKRVANQAPSELDHLEVPILGQMFTRSLKYLIVIRSGIMGGDVRDIHGGWVYLNDILLRADWEEIRQISRLGDGKAN